MAFATLYPLGIQIRSPDLVEDEPVFMDEEPSPAEDGAGFDEVVRTYLLKKAVDTVREAISAHFPRGQQLAEGVTLWVKKATGRMISVDLFELKVVYHGRIDDAIRYDRKTGAAIQQASADNTIISMGGGYPFTYPTTPVNARSNEAALSIQTSYVTTEPPDLAKVSETTSGTDTGYNPLPEGYPALPSPPANKWTFLLDPVWNFPAGWILEGRESDQILDDSGTPVLWFVKDTHVYYHQIRPAG